MRLKWCVSTSQCGTLMQWWNRDIAKPAAIGEVTSSRVWVWVSSWKSDYQCQVVLWSSFHWGWRIGIWAQNWVARDSIIKKEREKKAFFKKNLFKVSFCVTASPTDTPSVEDDFLRIFRWAGFLRIIALKIGLCSTVNVTSPADYRCIHAHT